MAGEDLRRRIFLTENENGDSLCLRPEFTIPVCRNHIALNAATPKRYAYLGEVFRQHRDGAAEFLQAGIEDLGAADEAASDARSVADALSCVRAAAPDAELEIVLGDQSVFAGMLKALGLPQGWRKKLLRAFGDARSMDAALGELTAAQRSARLPEVLAVLVAEGTTPALRGCSKWKCLKPVSPGAGRSPAEIARRLIEKEDLAATRFPASTLDLLKQFLETRVPLDSAAVTLRAFAADHALDLGAVLQKFEARAEAIAEAGISTRTLSMTHPSGGRSITIPASSTKSGRRAWRKMLSLQAADVTTVF